MSIHKPPTSDGERLENLLAAWCSPEDDAYQEDEEEAEPVKPIDFDAWAEEIRGKVASYAESARHQRAADAGVVPVAPDAGNDKAAGGGRRR